MPRISPTLLLLAAAVAAAEPTTIVVTAERRETDASRAPVSIEVVTQDDIHDRGGVNSGVDWLRERPGVGVLTPNGGLDGGTVRVSLRGVDPSLNQVLVDGIPLNDPTGTSANLNWVEINPAGTSRVEILKGAQSGLYGSRAVGGVINVIGARPTARNEGSVRLTTGRFHTNAFEAVATGPIGQDFGYAVSANGLTTDGFSTTTDIEANGNPDGYEPDPMQRWSGNARLQWRPVSGLELYASGMRSRESQAYDGYPPPLYVADPNDAQSITYMETNRIATGGRWKAGRTTVAADLARTWHSTTFRDSGSPLDSNMTSREDYASVHLDHQATQELNLSLGLDMKNEYGRQGDQDQPVNWEDDVRQRGVYAGVSWSNRHYELSLVGREDHHPAFGNQATGRAAAAVFLADGATKLRAAIGNGFTAPSLYQLYGVWGSFYQGNPNLEPQRANSYEAGIDWRARETATLSATAFRTDYRRKIEYVDVDGMFGPIPATYQNLSSDARVQGLESSARLSDIGHAGIELLGWYTWIHSDDGNGNDVIYVPENSGGARAVAHQDDKQRSWWESLGVTSSNGFVTGSGQKVSTYTVCDASCGVTLDRRWEASVRVENALDAHYEINPGYSTAPRMYYLTLGAKF